MQKWREVERRVLQYIREKHLKEGDRLPTDAEFAQWVGCSIQPVQRAMEELQKQGRIRRGSGSPTTVVDQPPLQDDHQLSFTSATYAEGHQLVTRLLEVSRRPPLADNAVEVRAQKALGLRREEPVLAIARLRLLDGVPRVLHRAYLNPGHFPATFLTDHDFTTESLIGLYNACGYGIEARQTILRARLASEAETAVMKCGPEPLLEVEQITEAFRVHTHEQVPLEYLHAIYVNWEYRVTNRRPPSAGAANESDRSSRPAPVVGGNAP